MSYRLTLIFESAQEMADVLNDIALNHNELNVDVHVPEFVSAQKSPRPDSLQRQADAMDAREIEIREQLWRAKSAHMTLADSRAKSAYIKSKVAAKRRDEMAARRHGLALDAIGSLACPQCFATKGHPCSGRNGEPQNGYAHPYRIIAMERGMSTEEMAHELSLKYAKAADAGRVMAKTDCPKCGVAKREPCVSSGGHTLSAYVHTGRRQQAEGIML